MKAVCGELWSGLSGGDRRTAEMKVTEAELCDWQNNSEKFLAAVSCFVRFVLLLKNCSLILQTDIICCSARKLICSSPQIGYLVKLTYGRGMWRVLGGGR